MSDDTTEKPSGKLTGTPRQTSEPLPYVREQPARRSVEAIDDFANADEGVYAHDSDYDGRGLQARGYRQSRRDSQQLRRDLHYGQYLEVPKGRKDIFKKRERRSNLKTFVALVAVLALLAAAIWFLWQYMNTNWGAASWS